MWKVAIVHFALTVFVVWKLLHYSAWSGPIEKEVWFNAWGLFWLKVFVFLQPLLSFLTWFFNLIHLSKNELSGLIEFLERSAMVFSIPLWSLCFGWIYVNLVNRLNHFSALGKKIF
jgi:hypothetical protein